jgi:threonine dehydrogenase-like Zn-dependent dehydrogenase
VLGAVFGGDRLVEVREFPDPEPGQGEAIVAIRASGMCGSDLHVYRAAPGGLQTSGDRIAGHEPAGVIADIGQGSTAGFRVGDRVTVHHYIGCTRCTSCRSGWPQMCSEAPFRALGTHVHGGHASLMRVPLASLVPLDERLTFQAGATIGCGTGTAWGALERLGEVGGSIIAVFGQGPVGLSATMLATARGAQVLALDPSPQRLDQARKFGAFATIDPTDPSSLRAIRELTHGEGVEAAVETSGSSQAVSQAMAALAPWGRLALVGLGGEARFRIDEFLDRQVTIMTSWTMSIVQQRKCADFIVRKELPIDDLFSHQWRLDQVSEAYEEFDKQRAGKGVVLFDSAV